MRGYQSRLTKTRQFANVWGNDSEKHALGTFSLSTYRCCIKLSVMQKCPKCTWDSFPFNNFSSICLGLYSSYHMG